MDTVLVTGGAGFIGSELVAQLVQRGSRVIVVDNLANGKRENLAGLPPDRVELVVADIREVAKVEPLLARSSVVFHLACLGVRHSIHSPRENHDVNASGTLALLLAARRARIKRFVYVSSSEVYGTAQRVPIDENHPTYPCTVYGASKLVSEAYTRAMYRTYGFPTVIVRPFNTYGPRSHHEGDCGEVIPRMLLRALAGKPLVIFGDGSQTRDFTFVDDTARGIIQVGLDAKTVGETINIGSGAEVTIEDLAHTIAGVAGRSSAAIIHDTPRPGDVLRLCADITRARQLVGFAPTVRLVHGLARLNEWYRTQSVSVDALLAQEVLRNWEGAGAEQYGS